MQRRRNRSLFGFSAHTCCHTDAACCLPLQDGVFASPTSPGLPLHRRTTRSSPTSRQRGSPAEPTVPFSVLRSFSAVLAQGKVIAWCVVLLITICWACGRQSAAPNGEAMALGLMPDGSDAEAKADLDGQPAREIDADAVLAVAIRLLLVMVGLQPLGPVPPLSGVLFLLMIAVCVLVIDIHLSRLIKALINGAWGALKGSFRAVARLLRRGASDKPQPFRLGRSSRQLRQLSNIAKLTLAAMLAMVHPSLGLAIGVGALFFTWKIPQSRGLFLLTVNGDVQHAPAAVPSRSNSGHEVDCSAAREAPGYRGNSMSERAARQQPAANGKADGVPSWRQERRQQQQFANRVSERLQQQEQQPAPLAAGAGPSALMNHRPPPLSIAADQHHRQVDFLGTTITYNTSSSHSQQRQQQQQIRSSFADSSPYKPPSHAPMDGKPAGQPAAQVPFAAGSVPFSPRGASQLPSSFSQLDMQAAESAPGIGDTHAGQPAWDASCALPGWSAPCSPLPGPPPTYEAYGNAPFSPIPSNGGGFNFYSAARNSDHNSIDLPFSPLPQHAQQQQHQHQQQARRTSQQYQQYGSAAQGAGPLPGTASPQPGCYSATAVTPQGPASPASRRPLWLEPVSHPPSPTAARIAPGLLYSPATHSRVDQQAAISKMLQHMHQAWLLLYGMQLLLLLPSLISWLRMPMGSRCFADLRDAVGVMLMVSHCLALAQGALPAYIGVPLRLGRKQTLQLYVLRISGGYVFCAALCGLSARSFEVMAFTAMVMQYGHLLDYIWRCLHLWCFYVFDSEHKWFTGAKRKVK